jgi:biopolymer transport protein ExbD
MAFSARVSGNPLSAINVTPLVDVMLVLLIIFMITAPILTHKVALDLPLGHGTVVPAESVRLAIHADGTLYWNDVRVDEAELEAQLAVLALQKTPPSVHIVAEGNTSYQIVARVLADANAHGVTRISII